MAGWLKNGLVGLVAAATLGLSGPVMAQETNPKGYDVPSTDPANAQFVREIRKKIDGVDAIIKGYITKDGRNTKFSTITMNGKQFWYDIHKGDQYVDRDCDGVHETKYTYGEHWELPDCVK